MDLDVRIVHKVISYVLYITYSRPFLMSAKLTASTARQNFSDILHRAAYGGERIVVHRGKRPMAAVVPIEDLELLEKIEDRIDLSEARKRLNEPTIPWSKIRKELGL
jgi:prevent-host-death family protein